MGHSQVKILQTCCCIETNQNASFRQAKRFLTFIVFINKFRHIVHSAQTHVAMLELKNRTKQIQVFFEFSSKIGQNDSCEVGFDIPPPQFLNLSALTYKKTSWLLGQRSTISIGLCTVLMLHCQTYQHFNNLWWFFKPKWREHILLWTQIWTQHLLKHMKNQCSSKLSEIVTSEISVGMQ